MLPIPKHLENILIPFGKDNNEYQVIGHIQCNCGSKEFKIRFVGDSSEYLEEKVIKVMSINDHYFLIVKATCKKCNKEHLLFDADIHGWNGFICHDEDESKAERLNEKEWNCPDCNDNAFFIEIKINSQGKQDFVEEAGEEYNPNDWINAFEWITINLTCSKCKKENKEWISYETM
jgi:hypothetical protein